MSARKACPELHAIGGTFAGFDPEPSHDGRAVTYGILHLDLEGGRRSIAVQSETMMERIATLKPGDAVRLSYVADGSNPRRLVPAFIERAPRASTLPR